VIDIEALADEAESGRFWRKLLLLDIETAPATAYVWRLFDENIGLDQIIAPGRIICWAAKWVGRKDIFYSDERGGHKKMLGVLAGLLAEADAVVTYNGDKFDLPKINGAMVEHGLPPLPPVASIDVIKTVRKLGGQSNKLAYIVQHLGVGKKIETGGFKLWAGCLAREKSAWEKMRRYNIGDVRILERLYRRLLPYMTNHPHLGVEVGRCPKCRSANLTHRGFRYTRMYSIERIACRDCGGWSDGARHRQK
jgi:hypothetical protein